MQSDRDKKHMYEMWGTDELITDYGNSLDRRDQKKMLREIANDDRTPKNVMNVHVIQNCLNDA